MKKFDVIHWDSKRGCVVMVTAPFNSRSTIVNQIVGYFGLSDRSRYAMMDYRWLRSSFEIICFIHKR